jgi:uncharacterized repeat protein (TIGR02543 family)
MEWSDDHGASWNGPSSWAAGVDTPPAVAASHDGDSVMVAYTNAAGLVTWAVDPDPTDLTWGAGTFWGSFGATGTYAALAVDGVGSTSPSIGGNYHLSARTSAAAIAYASAPVNLTGGAAWSPFSTPTDAAVQVSAAYPERMMTTVLRAGTWWPALAWTDYRNGAPDYDPYFTTPGGTYTIDTMPGPLQVLVDGTPGTAPIIATWIAGTLHSVNAPSPQTAGTGWRYVWANWSDGGASSHTLFAIPGTVLLTANFTSEYLLTLTSARGGVTGGGWYPANAIATIAATSPQSGSPGERYVFAAWTGDLISDLETAYVTMAGPRSITANWRTEYRLTITSDHGNVTQSDPDGWYDANDDATILLAAREVTEGEKTWEFVGWAGDASGTTANVTVRMDGPKTVTARWREKPGLLSSPVVVLGALGLAVLFLLILGLAMRRRKKPAPGFQQMHTAPAYGTVAPAPPTPPEQAPQGWPPPGPPR